jgi:hypothetical protein
MLFKSLFLIKQLALRVYVVISAYSPVVPKGNAENYSAIGVVLADHDYH